MDDTDALTNGLAGAGGGFITQLGTYPLQTVNTRQQMYRNERREIGIFEQMYHIVEQEGWVRLYGGFAPSLVGIATSQGVHNYFYKKFRNKAEATALAGCVSVLLTNPISLVVTRMQTHTKKSQPNQSDLLSPEDVIPSAVEPAPFGISRAIFGVMDDADAVVNGLARAGGGFIAQLVTYPLQTINTRQQIERGRNERRKIGTLEQMNHIVEQEGWERLYGGFAPSLVGIATSESVHNYFYQKFKNKAEATALAGCVSALLTNPISLVVTRMQTHRKKSQPNRTDLLSPEDVIPSEVEPPPFGINLAIQEVYDERGVLGFWRGALPTLIMVSKPSIQYMLYEPLLKELKKRKRLSGNKRNRNVTSLEVFLLETLANLGATVVTYPLLVIKSRLQAKETIEHERHQYKGTADAIDKMIRYEGWYGFYKGLSSKIAQSVLAAALPFMLKEKLDKGAYWVLLQAAILFFKFLCTINNNL